MARRQGKPLGKVGRAADNANGLISDIRRFGLDLSIPSTNPLTFRLEIADRATTKADQRSAVDLFRSLFK